MRKTDPKLLTIDNAAAFLGVSVETVRRWVENSTLSGQSVGEHKDLLFSKEELLTLVRPSQEKIQPSITQNPLFFKKVADAVPAMVVVYNIHTGKYIYVNDAIQKILGYAPSEFTRKGLQFVSSLVHPEDLPRITQQNMQALQMANKQAKQKNIDEAIVEFEYRMRHRRGHWVWLHTDGSVFSRTPENMVDTVLNVSLDITSRKHAEENLLQLHEQLEEKVQERTRKLKEAITLRNEFLSMASHELKTPVTSLKAYAQALQNQFAKLKDEKSYTHLTKMIKQIDKLTHLISDLLDVTKIESGRLRFREAYFYFDELVDEVIEQVQRTSTSHTIIKKGTAKKTVYADRDRIGQVLTNLLTNAIKYSPNATQVIVHVSSDSRSVLVSVEDFGVGISSEKREHIFERFYRGTGHKEDTFPGLGLGLYISKQIVTRQMGQIWVDSAPGKGSTFRVRLPLSRFTQFSRTLEKPTHA